MNYLARVQDILQEMEELTGPELEEYIEIMESIKEEVDTRLVNATASACKPEVYPSKCAADLVKSWGWKTSKGKIGK